MTDLPVSSITSNHDTATATAGQPDEMAAKLNSILNQPVSQNDFITQLPVSGNNVVNDDPSDSPADAPLAIPVEQPLIQIDLKKSYKQKQPQERQPTSSAYSSYGAASFGAPRPVEMYTVAEDVNQPQHAENIVSPEIEKSAEVLKPEQPANANAIQQTVSTIQQAAIPQVVDLRTATTATKPKKKDVAETASKLTLQANNEEDEFIESILGAHGD